MHESAARIQRCFKVYVFRCTVMEGLAWRQRVKSILMNVVEAWRTRRALNCLGSEVQEYVNCEVPAKKARMRVQFLELFDQVLANKLYLESKCDHLTRLIMKR